MKKSGKEDEAVIEACMTVATRHAFGHTLPAATDGLTDAKGVAVLRRILASPYHRVAVSIRDLPRLMSATHQHFATHTAPMPVDVPATDRPSGFDAIFVNDEMLSGDPVLAALTSSFRQILNDPGLGPDDSFFERGGHSLLAMQVLSFIRERFRVSAGLAVVFDHPTARGLAQYLQNHQMQDAVDAEGGSH